MKHRIYSLCAVLAAAVLLVAGCTAGTSGTGRGASNAITGETWAPDVKTALCDFVHMYGNPEHSEYVVSDFDNTASIFDVSLQMMPYQLEHMCFEMAPEKFSAVIPELVKKQWPDFTGRAQELCKEYAALYASYGPFTAAGVDDATRARLLEDPRWQGFAAEMCCLYQDMSMSESSANAFIWVMDWFAGMTEKQLYDMACRSHEYARAVPTALKHYGNYSYTDGIAISDNTKEMWKAFKDNGIDVWVCSASTVESVMAAVDVFGMHDLCKGVVAMTMARDSSGRYDGRYDYENGHAWLSMPDGTWKEDNVPTGVEVWGDGKVTAIDRCIAPKYDGRGPLACFGDSTGDFNFCTEYSSIKLVICFNRASRKVTDGGGLLSEVAVYEKETLGYDLAKAVKAGDVLYVLQGRDENGLRALRPSEKTLRFGAAEDKLFVNADNEAQLEWFKTNKLTVKQILEGYCITTEASDPANKLGFKYGFQEHYNGYKNK